MTLTDIIIIVAFVLIGCTGLWIWWYMGRRNKKKNSVEKPVAATPVTKDPAVVAPADIPEIPESKAEEPVHVEEKVDPKTIACNAETHRVKNPVPSVVTDYDIIVGTYDTCAECGCEWSVVAVELGKSFLNSFRFQGGNIYARVSEENDGAERTVRYITQHHGKSGTRSDYFDVTQKAGVLKEVIEKFSQLVSIPEGGLTYNYLTKLFNEAKAQYYFRKSAHGLPVFYKVNNFPTIYRYYNAGISCDDNVFKTLVGYSFSMVLEELNPSFKTKLSKMGYEMGGIGRYANVYGYDIGNDPNVARVVAGFIYSAMRGLLRPDMEAMRTEVDGHKFIKTLDQLYDEEKRDHVSDDAFYIDLREFMPTAPGPYAPGYENRPDDTYPNEQKDEYRNLTKDREIHEYVVRTYNLDGEPDERQEAVQAIADKDSDRKHLFGDNMKVKDYTFHPVFGKDTIGVKIDPECSAAKLTVKCLSVCSSARGILQSATVSPKQYGRLRPGCSWEHECMKNSSQDDRRNALCDFWIEDGDGNPTGYYDGEGNWTYPSKVGSPDQYEEMSKNSLYANSFPSGHSSGIIGAALLLTELMPDKADLLMREAFDFSNHRSVARYHWTSDIINGRVLGAAMFAVCHATSDFEDLLKDARESL